MTLKFRVKTLDEVPEAHRSLYVESDGGFTLPVEGAVPKDKVDEFRNSNITLRRQLEETTSRFDGIDPEKARALLTREQQIAEKKLIDAGDIDGIVQERVNGLIKDHQKTVGSLTAERDGLQRQLHTHLVHGEVRTAAIQAGVRPAALDDVVLRADQLFRAKDGVPAAFKGDEMLYGKDGVNPLRPAEWISTQLRETAPHLFEQSSGSGAQPGNGAGGARAPAASAAGTVRRSQLDADPGKYREDIMAGKLRVVAG